MKFLFGNLYIFLPSSEPQESSRNLLPPDDTVSLASNHSAQSGSVRYRKSDSDSEDSVSINEMSNTEDSSSTHSSSADVCEEEYNEPVLSLEYTTTSKRKFNIPVRKIVHHCVIPSQAVMGRCSLNIYCNYNPLQPHSLQFSSDVKTEELLEHLNTSILQCDALENILRNPRSFIESDLENVINTESMEPETDENIVSISESLKGNNNFNYQLPKHGTNVLEAGNFVPDGLGEPINDVVSVSMPDIEADSCVSDLLSPNGLDSRYNDSDLEERCIMYEKTYKPSRNTMWMINEAGSIFYHDRDSVSTGKCCDSQSEHRLSPVTVDDSTSICALKSGLAPGASLMVTLTVGDDAKDCRFFLNLQCSPLPATAVALHLSPRASQSKVVLNSYEGLC